jgi:CRP-like cAMP-binding protein
LANLIARRLGQFSTLSPSELSALAELEATAGAAYAPGVSLRLPGAGSQRRFLADGWAACVVSLQSGREQIVQFLLPGDLLWPDNYAADDTLQVRALTPVKVVHWPGAGRQAESAGVQRAIEAAERQHVGFLLDHVTRLGALDAYCRIGHILLELHDRCHQVGLAREGGCAIPVTQAQLADALGLTPIHVNRTVRQMRADHNVIWGRGRLMLPKRDELAETCGYAATWIRR